MEVGGGKENRLHQLNALTYRMLPPKDGGGGKKRKLSGRESDFVFFLQFILRKEKLCLNLLRVFFQQ